MFFSATSGTEKNIFVFGVHPNKNKRERFYGRQIAEGKTRYSFDKEKNQQTPFFDIHPHTCARF